MVEKRIIRKVIENKTNKQKLITIPKNSDLEVDEWVELIRVPPPLIKNGEK